MDLEVLLDFLRHLGHIGVQTSWTGRSRTLRAHSRLLEMYHIWG